MEAIQNAEVEPTPSQNMKTQLKAAGAGKVVCRRCSGDHFTAKCPYKDTLSVLKSSGMYLNISNSMPADLSS